MNLATTGRHDIEDEMHSWILLSGLLQVREGLCLPSMHAFHEDVIQGGNDALLMRVDSHS